jgi:putative ATP-dependent endonuclease of OLD family
MTEKSKVEIFYDESGKGKTFEYDLAFENVETNIMFPDSFEIIKDNEELNMAIENSNWSDKEKIRAKKAASYLINVSKLKGENAFDLERNLRENLPIEKRKDFKIPLHITRAILWVCDDLIKSGGNNVSD